jgi:Cu-Zn family superoxide dismutase
MKTSSVLFAPVACCALLLFGSSAGRAAGDAAPVTAAVAVILPTTGNETAGIVTFTATDSGVKVIADVTGLTPGKHGFHIHEFGDVSDSAKAMRTGGHYDPDGTHHHALVDADQPAGMAHHAGDMGNLVADSAGKAHLDITLQGMSLMGPANPIVGRAVIIHAKSDDGGQPVGNAGDRVGQGVIGIAKAK